MNITAACKFKRKYIYSMGEKYSKFRGKGIISIDGETITITGRRLYIPTIFRGVVILSLLALPIILSKINYIMFWPLIIFCPLVLLMAYYFMQYVILKKEHLSLKWEEISKYEIRTKGQLIVFTIENNPSCSPVVLQPSRFDDVASAFRENISTHEKTSFGLKAMEQRYDDQIRVFEKVYNKLFRKL